MAGAARKTNTRGVPTLYPTTAGFLPAAQIWFQVLCLSHVGIPPPPPPSLFPGYVCWGEGLFFGLWQLDLVRKGGGE